MLLIEDWIGNWTLYNSDSPDYTNDMLERQYNGARPNAVIFSDTKNEPDSVYRSVEYARDLCTTAGIPFYVVSVGDLAKPEPASTGTQGIFTPVYTRKLETDGDGPAGLEGQLRRQCTGRFKIDPCISLALSLAEDRPIEIYLGISVDEVHRAKRRDPKDRIQYRYPLFEGTLVQWSRHDCLRELRAYEVTASKSACVFCPYRRNAWWVDMYRNDRKAFAKAVEYDEWVREQRPGYHCYVSDERRPLDTVVRELVASEEAQGTLFQLGLETSDGFGGCEEGFCAA